MLTFMAEVEQSMPVTNERLAEQKELFRAMVQAEIASRMPQTSTQPLRQMHSVLRNKIHELSAWAETERKGAR